jgi:hypothetical protein
MQLCREALATGPKTTRELAAYVMKAKGLDPADKVLAKSIGNQLIHTLRMQRSRGKLATQGKRQAAYVWAIPGT